MQIRENSTCYGHSEYNLIIRDAKQKDAGVYTILVGNKERGVYQNLSYTFEVRGQCRSPRSQLTCLMIQWCWADTASEEGVAVPCVVREISDSASHLIFGLLSLPLGTWGQHSWSWHGWERQHAEVSREIQSYCLLFTVVKTEWLQDSGNDQWKQKDYHSNVRIATILHSFNLSADARFGPKGKWSPLVLLLSITIIF